MKLNIFNRGPVTAPPPKPVPVAPVERKAAPMGSVLAAAVAESGSAWAPRDAGTLVRNGFCGNPVGFRSVKLIAEACAALPLTVADATQRYQVHPVKTLLTRPNPVQGRAELIEALVAQILLSGDGFIEAVGGAEGALPLELHILRSDRMTVVPGRDGWPVGLDYRVGGKTHRYDLAGSPPPVCHIRSFHPQDDHYGFAPLQAAATAMEVHNAASRWSKALLENAARPSGAIVYKGPDGGGSMSNDQYERLIDEMAANYQGARNAGRPMLLEGGLDWKPMGFSPSDMEFQKTKEAAAREIALAFGIPPMLLGIPGDATYANYQEANRAFYRLTVLPLVERVAAALSSYLDRFTGAGITVAPDLDAVPALATEREAQWRRIADADFLDDDEKRALLGLPPRPMGGAATP